MPFNENNNMTILLHNKNFEQVNAKIREYCQSFLDIGKQKEESKNSDN
jgi:hypothetical protein